MSITPIITPAEADAYLAAYPDWLALDEPTKEMHIYNASLYIQTNWECTGIDWEDDLSIPEEVDHACALYALADSVGNLYGDITDPDDRKTYREMIKAGAVTLDTYYSASGVVQTGTQTSFSLADELMGLHCTSESDLGSVELTRV